jgi:hypothetical protein
MNEKELRNRNSKRGLYIFEIFFMFFILYFVHTKNSFYTDRKAFYTLMNLSFLNKEVTAFHKIYGKYPETLTEIFDETNAKKNMKYTPIEFITYSDNIVSECNNQGGWIYNNKTGTVKVNLKKPIFFYYPLYFGQYWYEIPYNWKIKSELSNFYSDTVEKNLIIY